MKPTQKSPGDLAPLLAFAAHPDDIEFGCGALVALETRAGRAAHFVNCSRGEAATHGTPEQRTAEAEKAAALLGASVEWLDIGGDAHFEVTTAHTIKIAGIIRTRRPGIILAPSLVENQHPDHARLGRLVRDAARLARYGGVSELRDQKPHSIGQLFYYAITVEAEPEDISPLLIDISEPAVVEAWTAAMSAHASQVSARAYVEVQLARARLNGQRAGIGHAITVYPNDPPILESLAPLSRGARHF